MNKNNKFIEFVLNHQNFYNQLSSVYKQEISGLDIYGNLEIVEVIKKNDDIYVYLNIGETSAKDYVMFCKYNSGIYNISGGKLLSITKPIINKERKYV